MATRFCHIADVHLDRALVGLGPDLGAKRRQELRSTLQKTVELARQKADLLIIAGDLFEDETVSESTLHWLRELLAEAPPTVIAPGNHDPAHLESPYVTMAWPSSVTVFGAEFGQVWRAGLRIGGRAFTTREASDPALEGAQTLGPLDILVVHGDLMRVRRPSPYRPFDSADVRALDCRYLALGHIHQRIMPASIGNTALAYPGSLEPLDVGEQGPHGVLLGSVDDDKIRIEAVDVACRSAAALSVSVAGLRHEQAVAEAVRAAAGSASLLDVTLKGEREREGPFHKAEIKRLLADVFQVRLVDLSEAPINLASLAGEGSVRGQFVRLLLERLETADSAEATRLRAALDVGLAALAGQVPTIQD